MISMGQEFRQDMVGTVCLGSVIPGSQLQDLAGGGGVETVQRIYFQGAHPHAGPIASSPRGPLHRAPGLSLPRGSGFPKTN